MGQALFGLGVDPAAFARAYEGMAYAPNAGVCWQTDDESANGALSAVVWRRVDRGPVNATRPPAGGDGALMRAVGRLLPHTGHIYIADNPGRHEPGTGEIAFERLLPWIDALGYQGHIGCEYLPAAGTAGGLGWARQWLEETCT
jgi:hypothetical protein